MQDETTQSAVRIRHCGWSTQRRCKVVILNTHSPIPLHIHLYPYTFTYTLTHPPIPLRIQYYPHTFTYTLTHPPIPLRIQHYPHTFTYTLTHSPIPSHIHLYPYTFTYTLTHSPIHLHINWYAEQEQMLIFVMYQPILTNLQRKVVSAKSLEVEKWWECRRGTTVQESGLWKGWEEKKTLLLIVSFQDIRSLNTGYARARNSSLQPFSNLYFLQEKRAAETTWKLPKADGHEDSESYQWAWGQWNLSMGTRTVKVISGHEDSKSYQWAWGQWNLSMGMRIVKVISGHEESESYHWSQGQ